MTDKYIVSKLLTTEIFSVEGYLLPRKITSKTGNDLNLYQIRKKYLGESEKNPNVKTLLEFMKHEYPETRYIQELPIPMKNFFLNYRCLDFFLPSYGVGIELDSHYHDNTEENDSRADLYISREYGIKVLRLRLASEAHLEKDLDTLRKFFHTHKSLEINFPLDFSDIIASEFRRRNKEVMKEFEELEKKFSVGIYNGNLVITEEQEKIMKSILGILEIKYTIWNP